VHALEEGMALDLVDCRSDFVVVDQVDQAIGEKVRDADRSYEPMTVQLGHRSPRAVVVAERLVNEVEVEVVEPEASE
jgi:hypothetical protein